MTALAVTSIPVTSNFTDGIDLSKPDLRSFNKSVGAPVAHRCARCTAAFSRLTRLGFGLVVECGGAAQRKHLYEVDTHMKSRATWRWRLTRCASAPPTGARQA